MSEATNHCLWPQHRRFTFGCQLGLTEWAIIEWLGLRGMRWPALLPLLMKGRQIPHPQILLIHLGENDLGLMNGKALIIQTREDLACLLDAWPGVYIIFSAMLSHKV